MKTRKISGFTLVEVLVALAVVATALYAATGSVRATARGSAHLEETTVAHWAALNALNEFRLAPRSAEVDDHAETVTMYGHELVVSRRYSAASEDNLARVTVTVTMASEPGVTLYTLDAVLP
jgi:general secretion pathway protein I